MKCKGNIKKAKEKEEVFVEEIKQKTKKIIKKFSYHNIYIRLPMTSKVVKVKRRLNDEMYKLKKSKADVLRERKEQEELQRKFMALYRHMINEKHDCILNKKIEEIKIFTTRIKNWIVMIQLIKTTRFIMNHFYVNIISINRTQ